VALVSWRVRRGARFDLPERHTDCDDTEGTSLWYARDAILLRDLSDDAKESIALHGLAMTDG